MKALVLFLLLFASQAFAGIHVRHIAIQGDEIVPVKTAMGIATIIQVPDKPASVVIGDKAAFQIEYLDQGISIKPLRSGARTNLYIYTDYQRFNIQLVPERQDAADYVVYLTGREQTRSMSKPMISWLPISRRAINHEMTLHVDRVGTSVGGGLFVEFTIASQREEKVQPSWVWITQRRRVRPIQSLTLSANEVSPRSPVRGVIELLRSDLNERFPVNFELRRKQTCSVTLPRIDSWKQKPKEKLKGAFQGSF